ncbi:hypothetical protein PUN4_340085 [Paraburkholderia unamae]|nr:hypothetical protein PUN4_340085 [Paraburkholderia unamae]
MRTVADPWPAPLFLQRLCHLAARVMQSIPNQFDVPRMIHADFFREVRATPFRVTWRANRMKWLTPWCWAICNHFRCMRASIRIIRCNHSQSIVYFPPWILTRMNEPIFTRSHAHAPCRISPLTG